MSIGPPDGPATTRATGTPAGTPTGAPTAALTGAQDATPALAAAGQAMARRFHHGGRVLVFGSGSSAADAARLAAEFARPVVAGRRVLPAVALPGGSAGFAAELELLGERRDIALALATGGGDDALAAALTTARARGLLTVALLGAAAGPVARLTGLDHVLTIGPSARGDHLAVCLLLEELIHTFLDAPDGLA